MKELQEFLETQRMLVLATTSSDEIWTCTVFYAFENNKFYFISKKKAKHSQHVLNNKHVSFVVNWFNADNHFDRKAIQGKGICRIAKENELDIGVRLHNERYPAFKERITPEWIRKNDAGSTVWIIEPEYIKFWNDELFGLNETKEYHFSK